MTCKTQCVVIYISSSLFVNILMREQTITFFTKAHFWFFFFFKIMLESWGCGLYTSFYGRLFCSWEPKQFLLNNLYIIDSHLGELVTISIFIHFQPNNTVLPRPAASLTILNTLDSLRNNRFDPGLCSLCSGSSDWHLESS